MTKVFEAETTVDQWDSDYYTPISIRFYDQAVADMLKLMQAPAGATVLDAGCGPGVHSIRAARNGYSVQAIDISKTMLEHARSRVAQAGFADKVTFQQMDLTDMKLDKASVDYAFSWGVIIHIPEAEKAFKELARVMRPGGKLALYLTNKSALDHKLERLLRFLLRKPLQVNHLALGDGVSYRMNNEDLWVWAFDSDAIIKLLNDLGFSLVSRKTGEFTEIQRRLKGFIRNILLYFNNLYYAINGSASLAVCNLYVFEKNK